MCIWFRILFLTGEIECSCSAAAGCFLSVRLRILARRGNHNVNCHGGCFLIYEVILFIVCAVKEFIDTQNRSFRGAVIHSYSIVILRYCVVVEAITIG